MKKSVICIFLAGLVGFSPLCLADGLQALDDTALATVSGREGVAMDLMLQVNADTSGNPLPNLDYCAGTNSPCKMAFHFYNRDSGGGEWAVWKNFFGVLKMNNVWVDAGQAKTTVSPYPDTSSNNRFMSASGQCLPDGTKTADTCYQAVLGKPVLMMQLNGGNAGGLELYMNLGGVAVEYGATGYNNDTHKSALGILIGDTRGTDLATPVAYPAQAKIGGKIGLYGF